MTSIPSHAGLTNRGINLRMSFIRLLNLFQISDLGLCVLESEAGSIKEIKGAMPYMAPELFNGGTYSKATDVYAFGILMSEISSEEKPFHDVVYDKFLVLQILKGYRPTITKDTPLFY